MTRQLTPGNYFIEMAFRREVDEGTLARALAGMGFTNIEFDKNEDAVVGAITSFATLSKPAYSSTITSTSKPLISTVLASAPKTVSIAPVSKPAVVTAIAISTPKPATTDFVSVAKPSTAIATVLKAPVANQSVSLAPSVSRVIPKSNLPYDGISLGNPSKTGPAPATSSPSPASTTPTPAQEAYQEAVNQVAPDASASTTTSEPGDHSHVPQGGPVDEGSYDESYEGQAYAPEAHVEQLSPPAGMMASPEKALLTKMNDDMAHAVSAHVSVPDRWRRWVEWGSPFATSPAHLMNVSGEEESAIRRFRFVATLIGSLTPANLPDMSWVFIRRLALNPFSDLSFQLVPFRLRRDGFYEFRFFSRIKSNPTKDSVKDTLASMGFSPMKLSLLKKNMRIPRRGSVSMCLWLGIGRWTAPNSITTSEDPFFFESVKEVQP